MNKTIDRRRLEASVPERGGRRLETFDPFCLLFKGVYCCRGCLGAIWLPLLVCLLVSWLVGRASPVGRDVKGLHVPDAVLVQASLREEVLAHGTVLAVLDTNLPLD